MKNLTKAGAVKGQVATLLTLLMVILLVFVLATVNIGNMSVKATAIANAADSAALGLGSSLITEARALWEGLGNRFEKTQATGVLTMIIALVVAIIVTIVTWGAAWYTIVAAASLAGAAAGAISGAYIEPDIGATQGGIIGFQIGLAVGTIAVGAGAGVEGIACMADGTTLYAPLAASWGTVATGVFSLASTGAQGVQAYKYVTAAMEQISKDLMKLDKYDRFRESAFYTAMSQLVDDPNWKRDVGDINTNWKENDIVPVFLWWWHQRLAKYDEVRKEQAGIIGQLLNTMRGYKDFLHCQYDAAGQGSCPPTPGPLERLDYKWIMDGNGVDTAVSGQGIADDGIIAYVLRNLYNIGPQYRAAIGMYGQCGDPRNPVSMPMWQPGPTAASMNTWMQTECCSGEVPTECGGKPLCTCPPTGYDDVDDLGDTSRYWANFMDQIIREDMAAYTWSGWMQFFYTGVPDDGSYFNELGKNIAMLQELRNRILQARNLLPACDLGSYQMDVSGNQVCGPLIEQWGYYICGEIGDWCLGLIPGDCAHNFPCRLPAIPQGTFDEPAGDDMGPSISAIDNIIAEMTNFKNALEDFGVRVLERTVGTMSQYGGYNPVVYEWDDSRGHSVIRVQSGNYAMPKISKPYGSWRKKTVKLENYSDGGKCWIKVTKSEPSGNVGPLGKWNPFDPTGRGISKVGKVRYTLQGNGTPVLKLRN